MPADDLLPAGSRWAVRLERRLAHPPDRVWRAVSDPAQLSEWFPARVHLELRVGAPVQFTFGDDSPDDVAGSQSGGEVTDVDPPHLLAFTWEGEHIRLELAPDGDGTVLVLVHTFDDRGGAAMFAAGWDTCLAALPAVLAGEPVPGGPRRNVAYEEEAVVRFGLDRPTVEGGTARWERHLACPAEVARDLLPDGPEAEVDLVDMPGQGCRLHVAVAAADPATVERWGALVAEAARRAGEWAVAKG